MATLDVNLKDPLLFERGVPHELFARLRREAPVYWNPEPEPWEPGFWALTKYDDVSMVSRNPQLFSSARGGHQISYPPGVEFNQATSAIVSNMIGMDPPQHNVYRKLVASFFTPAAVKKMEPEIHDIVTRTLDRVTPLGACEFVESVAAEVPLVVLCNLLGVPQADRKRVFDWTNTLTDFSIPPEAQIPVFGELFASARRSPRSGAGTRAAIS